MPGGTQEFEDDFNSFSVKQEGRDAVATVSKFLHVNEKESNGCGIITQYNSIKEDWDMNVDKPLVLAAKNKECQKHIANTLKESEGQQIENPSAQPPLPPKPPDFCCRGASTMTYIVPECDKWKFITNQFISKKFLKMQWLLH